MSGQILIAGFSSTDKVPGAYGEVKQGAGASSAASIPLLLLLVGLAAAGSTATADTEIVDVYDSSIADTAFAPGSELACMCYDALLVPGVTIKALSVTPAGGAVAATLTITIAGSMPAAGTTYTWEYILAGTNGQATTTISGTITSTDTVTTIAAAIRDAINANASLPYSASAALGVVTLTVKTAGIRGNQHIVRQNRKGLGTVTSALAGGSAIDTDRVPFSGGSGVETLTNVLATLRPSQFDRIAVAQNDATSLAAWETQLDAQIGPLEGLLQQAIVAFNGSQAAATSLGQTTLNNPLWQSVHCLNSETHPSRIAAQVAALRTQAEQDDPAAAFDNVALPACAPQNRADWPKHSQLVSALNNSLTPLTGGPDNKVRIVRSITSKSLNGANPDYSTLDTSEVSVPHFVLKDLKVYWTTSFQPGNPRCADNPAEGEKERPAGVATPKLWNAEVEGKLREYEQGKIGGKTIAPIIIDVDSHKPFASYDGTADRIMSAVPLKVAPANHQIGISVRQL